MQDVCQDLSSGVWMEELNIFWTLHFLSSQLLRSGPKGLSNRPQKGGGGASKNVLIFGLCMCLSINAKTSYKETHPIIKT